MLPVEIDLNCKIPTAYLTPGESKIRIMRIKIMGIKIRIMRTCVQSKIGRHPFLSY